MLAGGIETPYRRAGCGPTVLLLVSGDAADTEDLVRDLSEGFRVIAPQVPTVAGAGLDALVRWFRDLVEGLGLERPAIVVEASLAPVARSAAGKEGWCARVVTLGAGSRRRRLAAVRRGLAGGSP